VGIGPVTEINVGICPVTENNVVIGPVSENIYYGATKLDSTSLLALFRVYVLLKLIT